MYHLLSDSSEGLFLEDDAIVVYNTLCCFLMLVQVFKSRHFVRTQNLLEKMRYWWYLLSVECRVCLLHLCHLALWPLLAPISFCVGTAFCQKLTIYSRKSQFLWPYGLMVKIYDLPLKFPLMPHVQGSQYRACRVRTQGETLLVLFFCKKSGATVIFTPPFFNF